MSELSNLLRKRLGAQNSAENGAGVHPDADTLTAYSEQLLPTPERQQVLKHLAACADCREVLALSQAELPALEMQPVLKPAPVSLWRKLLAPALGVVGVIAATALIAILITQSPSKPGQMANGEVKSAPSNQQPPAQPSTASATENQAANDEAGAAAADKDRSVRNTATPAAGLAALPRPSPLANRLPAPAKTAPAPAPPVVIADLRKKDFVNNAFFDSCNTDFVAGGQSNSDYPAGPKPQGTAYDTRLSAIAPRSLSDIPQNAGNTTSTAAILTPRPPQEHFGSRWEKIVSKSAHVLRSPLSAPAISSGTLGRSAMLASPRFDTPKAEQSAAVAASPAAKAENDSFSFTASGAMSGAARSSLSAAETAAASWKVAQGKLLKAFGQSPWEEARTPAAFEFTTVTARAGEVWAGGANAGLIHSGDGGNMWTLVKLGEGASGSIVSIFFAGNHVQVKTSDDQSWISSDGGKSWVRN